MREQIYTIIQEDPVPVYDSGSIDFSTFKWTNGYYNHKLTKKEIEKPYILSFQYYGVVDYEEMILLVNNIPDIFEVPIGTSIKIPKLDDLKIFILENTN
jgi:hypothetical protein